MLAIMLQQGLVNGKTANGNSAFGAHTDWPDLAMVGCEKAFYTPTVARER